MFRQITQVQHYHSILPPKLHHAPQAHELYGMISPKAHNQRETECSDYPCRETRLHPGMYSIRGLRRGILNGTYNTRPLLIIPGLTSLSFPGRRLQLNPAIKITSVRAELRLSVNCVAASVILLLQERNPKARACHRSCYPVIPQIAKDKFHHCTSSHYAYYLLQTFCKSASQLTSQAA